MDPQLQGSPASSFSPEKISPIQVKPTAQESSGTLPPTDLPSPQSPSNDEPARVGSDAGTGFSLRIHPEGPLYVGDQVSLEVIAPPNPDLEGKDLLVQVNSEQGLNRLGQVKFAPYGLGRRLQATLLWVWDTKSLSPGNYELVFSLLPEGPIWSEWVILNPSSDQPHSDQAATWSSAETDCCTVHYITGTAAQRDLDLILEIVQDQAQKVSQEFGIDPEEKISLVLLPRVLGHGGFASNEISISYLDRNYAGAGFPIVVHHEMVHWFDNRFKGDLKPSLLVEGLAVYLSGGHFKPEALLARAGALLAPTPGCTEIFNRYGELSPGALSSRTPACGLNLFIPFTQLAENFYPSQHEIGYLQAGALVEYMVNRWGWPAFSDFYRDIHPLKEGEQDRSAYVSTAIEAALQKHFSIDLAQLEQDFMSSLKEQELTPEIVADVQLSVSYYDLLREYQALMDPSAYYLYAWLADSAAMRERGITADYLRRQVTPYHQALELMFLNADQALRSGDYLTAAMILGEINAILGRWADERENAFEASSLASDMLALVKKVHLNGYEAHKIELEEDRARVWVSLNGPELVELIFDRAETGWQIQRTTRAPLERLLFESLWAGI